MSVKDLFELKANVTSNNNCYAGQKVAIDIEFNNPTNEVIFFDNVIIFYECHCSINLFHLKRFHNKSDVEKILTKYCKLYNVHNNNINQDIFECDQFLILKTELSLFEKKALCAKEIYKTSMKIPIPEESISTYKSKYIHFHSVIKIRANLINSELPFKEIDLPITVKRSFLREKSNSVGSDGDDCHLNNFIKNPFEINTDNDDNSVKCLENDFSARLILDKQPSSKYKITYQNSTLCYLALLKPKLYIGDDIRIIINFVNDSPISCIKFSVTLKASEKLIIPCENIGEEPIQLTLSTKEIGPFFHECMCIEVYPVILYIPKDQYPTLNFEIFNFLWSLDFKFMIANSEDVSIDINQSPPKEAMSWSPKIDIKTELLKWELPINVCIQRTSEI